MSIPPARPFRATSNAPSRRVSFALGVFVIALLFLLETVMADRRQPNPLSPIIWTVLGTIAAVSLALSLWWLWRGERR